MNPNTTQRVGVDFLNFVITSKFCEGYLSDKLYELLNTYCSTVALTFISTLVGIY